MADVKTLPCEAGRWDKPCHLPATFRFTHAPKGTANPQRETIGICTRHKRMVETGTYPHGAYIMTSPFAPVLE